MDSTINQPGTVPQDISHEAYELVQPIHQALQRLSSTHREDARQRVIGLLRQMPSPQAMGEIMTILEPGFQAIQGRA